MSTSRSWIHVERSEKPLKRYFGDRDRYSWESHHDGHVNSSVCLWKVAKNTWEQTKTQFLRKLSPARSFGLWQDRRDCGDTFPRRDGLHSVFGSLYILIWPSLFNFKGHAPSPVVRTNRRACRADVGGTLSTTGRHYRWRATVVQTTRTSISLWNLTHIGNRCRAEAFNNKKKTKRFPQPPGWSTTKKTNMFPQLLHKSVKRA